MSCYEVPEPILNSPFEEPAEHWHIEEGAVSEQRPEWQISALRIYRAGRGDVVQRPAQQARGASEYRNHARLRAVTADAGFQCQSRAQARGVGKEIRCSIQDGVRRHPRTHDSAGA